MLKQFLTLLGRFSRKKTPDPMLVTGEDRQACCAVSRHGLDENGVTCPRCGELAVEPGDWRALHEMDRGTYIEEGAGCWNCGAWLLASPDDDIDPIKKGDDYDRDTYHRFARPEGWKPPRQTVLERPPREQDWVVVWNDFITSDTKANLKNGEGRVISIKDDIATVVLAGFAGIMRSTAVEIPLEDLRVMVFERYREGMRVRIKRGKLKGLEGPIISFRGGRLTLDVDGHQVHTIQEHVERLDLE